MGYVRTYVPFFGVRTYIIDIRFTWLTEYLALLVVISCVPLKTSRVFHAGHLVCSKQDISCVPRRTSCVFQTKHFLMSTQDISCVPRRTSRVVQAEHFLCSTQ